ncbi:MAG: translation initiation factor IF-2 N-terminal domain-containing protein, partial [Pseudomonadota bacterium]
MAVTTVAQLAAELNRSASALLEQLQSAGVSKASKDDALTDADKERLLDFLRSAHGTAVGERKKITVTRKSTSEIKQADASGKARTIQVEVRKKRTFIKRDDTVAAPVEEAAAPAMEEAELQRREEEAQRQAELLRRQEAELEEKRRLREEAQALREQEAKETQAREAAETLKKAEAAAAAAVKEVVANATTAVGAGAPAQAAAPAAPVAPPAEVKPALRVIKAADVVDEEKQRAADLAKRRKAAEDEASAIRAMMSAPRRAAMVAPKPVEPPKPEVSKEGIKGTIHKAPGTPGAATTTAVAKPGDKKSVKSEKLSSSWADDAKKRGVKGRTDAPPAGAARPGWRAPRGGRRGDRSHSNTQTFVAPAEQVIQDVHVPETISVADLAHKMSVKASEVIKQLMKLGQMVTINQQL